MFRVMGVITSDRMYCAYAGMCVWWGGGGGVKIGLLLFGSL